MKKICLLFLLCSLVTLSCNLSVAITPPTETASETASKTASQPTDTVIAVTEEAGTSTPSATPEIASVTSTSQPAIEGTPVFYGPLSLVLPSGVASGISGEQFPRDEGDGVAPWGVTPGHTQVRLEGYLLQEKFHEPQIYVYPSQAYAEQNPGVFENIHRLNNIISGASEPISPDQLPTVPFFNAAQLFGSNVQVIDFQNGQGVRFLTQYAQYFAPANNHELFYHFQGVTQDGAYYVIAVLPITVPLLAESSDPGAVLPAGGIPFPDMNDPEADFQGYYHSITGLLDATPSDTFVPSIAQLDALIQSMQVNP